MTDSMNVTKVAIIVPLYNDEEYIRSCLDSIIQQTVSWWEVWITDDCSSDSSVAIAEGYCSQDPRFHLIRNSVNSSAWVCRAKGIMAMSDSVEYVMFADADDSMEPNAVEEAYRIMSTNPVDILHFGTKVVAHGEQDAKCLESYTKMLQPREVTLRGFDVLKEFAERKFEGHLWNRMFNAGYLREIITKLGVDLNLPKAQDKALNWAVCCMKPNVTYRGAADCLYDYSYGLGVEGEAGELSIEKFTQYLGMAKVEDLVKDITKASPYSEDQCRDIIEMSRYNLVHHNVKSFMRLKESDKLEGLRLIDEAWTDPLDRARIVGCLAEYTWDDQLSFSKLFLESEIFRTRKSGSDIKVVGTYYHRMDNGGVQRVISRICEIWHDAGYDIVLFTDSEPQKTDYPLPSYVKRVKTDLIFSRCNKSNYTIRAMSIAKLLIENHIDCMVYHAYFSNVLLYDTCLFKSMGIPFVLYEHNVFSRFARYNDIRFSTIPFFSKLANAVVCLDDISCEWWKLFNSNSKVVLNPLSFDLNKVSVSKRTDHTILFLCRLDEYAKRPNDTLDIMTLVIKRVPDAQLMIVGTGADKTVKKLNDRIQSLDLSQNVKMCGFSLDVDQYYSKASIFLSCSSHEGAPMTLCEAQSYGLPIVMYDLPYLVISNSPGIISVPKRNIESAANAICELLLDQDKLIRTGNAGRAFLEKMYQTDLKAQWQTVFNSIRPENDYAPLPCNIGEVLVRDYYDGISRYAVSTDSKKEQALRRKLRNCSNQLNDIRNSWSFRIGRIITFIPRKIRDLFKKK